MQHVTNKMFFSFTNTTLPHHHQRFFAALFVDLYNNNNYSRVSVMRGQVITPQGLGIVGIRVSVDRDSRFGFTLTRQGGW